ncbi:MAG: hypothetical protein V1650_04435 [Candidatus Omnitrophota bacterium]
MAKKEYPPIKGNFKPKGDIDFNLDSKGPGISDKVSGKMSGFMSAVLVGLKFFFGICFLPLVFAFSVSFFNEFSLIDKGLQSHFWWGVAAFVAMYFFIWEADVIYAKGQELLEITFHFFKPFVRVAPYLLPIYTIFVFIIYAILSSSIKEDWLIRYMMFCSGATLSMHFIFSAKSIRGKKSDILNSNYIFGFSFVYILDLIIVAFCLSLIFKEFSFVNFFNAACVTIKDIFYSIFKQLFLR